MMTGNQKIMLEEEAAQLVAALQRQQKRLVLAESCTAGLVSATLAHTPGISKWLCGSAVTYREQTKIDWLQVSTDSLQQFSAVSRQVAEQMATGVLTQSVEADLAGSVTGHLGPDAPPESDGLIFVGVAERFAAAIRSLEVKRLRLSADGRVERQYEAARHVIRCLRTHV